MRSHSCAIATSSCLLVVHFRFSMCLFRTIICWRQFHFEERTLGKGLGWCSTYLFCRFLNPPVTGTPLFVDLITFPFL